MPLQIRVRHALGERLMELPDRTVEGPVVVGRSASSDVQIPSVNVAPRHCALFRHEGRWVVQDLGGTTGTFMKGKPVTGPTPLQMGEVITVGSEATPPTIEVDPAAAAEGRTGWAGELPASAAMPPPAQPRTPSSRQRVPSHTPRPMQHATGAAVPAYGASSAAYGAPPAGFSQAMPSTGGWATAADGDTIDMSPWQASPPTVGYASPSYRRRKQGTPVVGILVGLLICTGIVGGAYWLIRHRPPPKVIIIQPPLLPATKPAAKPARPNTRPATESPAPPPQSVVIRGPKPGTGDDAAADDTEPKPNSSSADNPSPGTSSSNEPKPAAHPPAVPAEKPTDDTTAAGPPATPPKPNAPDMADSTGTGTAPPKPAPSANPATPAARPRDPSATDDPAWAEIQDVIAAPGNAAIAIFRLADYQRSHPGQHTQEIDEAMDRKFDQLWWERIDQLFKKRDRLTTDIAKKKKALWDETNSDEKKKGLDEVKKMETDLTKSGDILRKEMDYSGDQPPDLSNASQLAALAKSRPAPKYEAWKKTTLKYLQNNQGKVPWSAEMQ
jgi:FHA domain